MTRLLDVGAPSVCLIGGLSDVLRSWLPPPLQGRLAAPAGDAMDGAVLMARRGAAAAMPETAAAAE
jgi:glucosamine kinase